MLTRIISLFTIVQVLGNAHLYPECENHMRLKEPWRQHVNNQPSGEDDRNLTAGWYRVFGQAGKRLLDINDIPKNILNATIVSLTFLSIQVSNFAVLLHNVKKTLTELTKANNVNMNHK